MERLTLAEYHEQEEIFKLRLGHLKKVCQMIKCEVRFLKLKLVVSWRTLDRIEPNYFLSEVTVICVNRVKEGLSQ